jgi:hypothetical protein
MNKIFDKDVAAELLRWRASAEDAVNIELDEFDRKFRELTGYDEGTRYEVVLLDQSKYGKAELLAGWPRVKVDEALVSRIPPRIGITVTASLISEEEGRGGPDEGDIELRRLRAAARVDVGDRT